MVHRIVGFALVEVLRSEKEGVPVGALMYGQTTWERYTVQPYIEGKYNRLFLIGIINGRSQVESTSNQKNGLLIHSIWNLLHYRLCRIRKEHSLCRISVLLLARLELLPMQVFMVCVKRKRCSSTTQIIAFDPK